MNNTVVRLAGIKLHSFVDGPGVRCTVFFQGCPHHCPNCHNPDTWDPTDGYESTVGNVISQITCAKYLDGVTFSGGEPFAQPAALYELVAAAKRLGHNIWVYSGWTYEQLKEKALDNGCIAHVLQDIDVLVDGPFKIELKDANSIFRGSSNQRLIEMPKTLETGKITLFDQAILDGTALPLDMWRQD